MPQQDQLRITSPQSLLRFLPKRFFTLLYTHTPHPNLNPLPLKSQIPPETSSITNKLVRTRPRIVEFELRATNLGQFGDFKCRTNPSLNKQTGVEVTHSENERKVWFIYVGEILSVVAFFLIHSFSSAFYTQDLAPLRCCTACTGFSSIF